MFGGAAEIWRARSKNATKPAIAKPFSPHPQKRKKEAWDAVIRELPPDPENFPRLLVIDPTATGGGTATGELKASLFECLPEQKLFHLYEAGPKCFGYRHLSDGKVARYAGNGFSDHALSLIKSFNPELILYRPAPRMSGAPSTGGISPTLHWVSQRPRNNFHRSAMRLIESAKTPLATWIVDDWPSALKQQNDLKHAEKLERDLRALFERSRVRLSISDHMSEAFKARYGVSFEAVANGVDPSDWEKATLRSHRKRLSVRYAGSLAENMTLSSVRQVASAVESLSQEGLDIDFQIKTRSLWRDAAAPLFSAFTATQFVEGESSIADYRSWLSAADVVLVAYNFDPASKSYTKFSLANKLPECMASGAVLMIVGPPDIATMKAVEALDCGVRITTDDEQVIADALRRLADNPQERFRLAQQAQDTAFHKMNIVDKRSRFASLLTAASLPADEATHSGEPRGIGAHVDETAVVARLLSNRQGRRHILLDVGAHTGASASYFHALGWEIYCFEPDPKNREKLTQRFQSAETVTIDARAVSDKPAEGVSFFTSEESTGISGLSAFHDTHRKTGKVDVTTVADIIDERGLSHIDFLKIDVEGFDFSVLKGVAWERLSPDVVECEFEDAKTVPLGHAWQEIADFLVEKGYTVYVSEWYPIIRYGIPHDWRRVLKYARDLQIPSDAWGNLLAFKKDPGDEVVRAAFSALTKRRSAGSSMLTREMRDGKSVAPMVVNEMQKSHQTFYAKPGEWLRVRSPRLFAIARTGKRISGAIGRRLYWIAPAFVFLSAMFIAGVLQNDPLLQLLISGGAVVLGFLAVVMYLGSWTYNRIRALSLETASLSALLATERRNATEQRRRDAKTRELDRNKLERRMSEENQRFNQQIQYQLTALQSSTEQMLSVLNAKSLRISEVEEVVAEIEQDLSSLEGDLDAARQAGAESKRQIGSLTDRAAKLESEVEAKSEALKNTALERDTIKNELSNIEREVTTAEQKRTLSENNLAALQKKYKELAEHSEAQESRLQKVYANVKAARQRITAMGRDG